MIGKKTLKIAMGVGMVLCASASFAGVSEGFESATDGAIGTNIPDWTGDGIVTNVGPTYAKTVGTPRGEATNSKTLLVEGEVTCANTATTAETTASVSDFLINIPELSDELEADGLDNAKIAVAAGIELVGDKIPLMLYCKAGSATAATWEQIATVDSNTWYRVTLVFKDKRCRVSLDGEPVTNVFGYTASTGGTTGGAWYNLASVPSNLAIGSLSFIGCATLDDVVIKDEFTDDAFTTDATLLAGEKASYNNLNKWGMTVFDVTNNWNTVLNETSGMTVGQKIACGYDPNSATKFEPVSITKTEPGQATIKFPIESTAELGRYKVVLDGGKAAGKSEVGDATDAGGGLAEINLSNLTYNQGSTVIKFTLKAEKPSEE